MYRKRCLQRFLVVLTAACGSLGARTAADELRGGRHFLAQEEFPLGLRQAPAHGMTSRAVVGLAPFLPVYHDYYYGTPWIVPQSRKHKFPPPVYEEPRLGLHYLYIHPGNPSARQFGIQMPPETDLPIGAYPQDEHPQGLASPSTAEGIGLLRRGQYLEAGRRFAQDLRGELTPPGLYFLIATALFAVGKHEDAAIVLRQAIEAAPDLEFLARVDLPSMFPSREALNEKLAVEIAPPLLRGTLRILAGQGEKGLSDLRAIQEKDPLARRLYLRFLGAAFVGTAP